MVTESSDQTPDQGPKENSGRYTAADTSSVRAYSPDSEPDEASLEAGYEVKDANVFGVVIAALMLFGFIAIVLTVSGGLINVFDRFQPVPTPLSLNPATPPPPPVIWMGTAAERQSAQAQEQSVMDTYGWVDQENGVVRIPITRAMQVLAEQGLPARDQAPPDFGRSAGYQPAIEVHTEDENDAQSNP